MHGREILKRYPKPWTMKVYGDSVCLQAANGMRVDWTFSPITEFIAACVNQDNGMEKHWYGEGD